MLHLSRSRLVVAFLVLGLAFSLGRNNLRLAAAADATDKSAADQAAASLYEGIRTETLPNGLPRLLKPISGFPVVTTMVAYKVGSADERLEFTGLSHYLEHLMFKGTDILMPGDIDRLTQRNGGQNNAYTTEDLTNYHFDFAADRWDAALEIEADRMRHLQIDPKHEFEQEKGNVIGELNRNEDQPWDLEQKVILPLLFGKGPYGHPVIGEREHVRLATAPVIKAHYDAWYHPNNAVLVVCGGFDADKAMAKIKTLFGPIPKGKLPERNPPVAIARAKPVEKEFPSKFDQARLLMGFNTVRSGDPGFYPLEVIQSVLTGGKTGRLYKKLVEQMVVASAVDSGNQAGRYDGWYAVQVEVLKGKSRQAAQKATLEEIQRLQDQLVDPAELARAKRGLLAQTIFARESVHGLADSIARGVCTNDLDFLKTYLPKIQAVTAKEIQDAARQFLKLDQRVEVWSVPQESGVGGKPGEKPAGSAKPRMGDRADNATAGGAAYSLKDVKRHVLPNGLTLLLLENHRLPIVVADAAVHHVALAEPEAKAGIAALVGSMLDEGAAVHSGPKIAEMIEDVGGSLSLHSSGGSVKVLSENRALGLGLLFECLTKPVFPAEALHRKKLQQLSALDDMETRPESKGERVFRETVYGKHPFGRNSLGSRKSVEALTVADCRAFHQMVFVPNNTTMAVVGDFDSKKVIAEITEMTTDWKWLPLTTPPPPEVTKPASFVEKFLSMPEAAEIHFYLGHPGIRRGEADFYRLLVMDYILGTGMGFTDRLSARLRDREGLGYTVTANITGSTSEEPGIFTCYIGTSPQNLQRVKKEFLEEIHRIRNELPTKREVEDVKMYLLGSLPFKLATSDRVAGLLLSIERFNLGFGYLEDYRKKIEAITPEDIQAVAKKYLDPAHMVLVVAGAIDATGKPLPKPKAAP